MKEAWTHIKVKGRDRWFIHMGRYEVTIIGAPGDGWNAIVDDISHEDHSRISCGQFLTWDEAEKWVLTELAITASQATNLFEFIKCEYMEGEDD